MFITIFRRILLILSVLFAADFLEAFTLKNSSCQLVNVIVVKKGNRKGPIYATIQPGSSLSLHLTVLDRDALHKEIASLDYKVRLFNPGNYSSAGSCFLDMRNLFSNVTYPKRSASWENMIKYGLALEVYLNRKELIFEIVEGQPYWKINYYESAKAKETIPSEEKKVDESQGEHRINISPSTTRVAAPEIPSQTSQANCVIQ
jgi:hypothetical protein